MGGSVRATQQCHSVTMASPPPSHSRYILGLCPLRVYRRLHMEERDAALWFPHIHLLELLTAQRHGADAVSPSAPPRAQPTGLFLSRGQARAARVTFLPVVPSLILLLLMRMTYFQPKTKTLTSSPKEHLFPKLRPQKQKFPLPDLCYSHQIIPQPPQKDASLAHKHLL